MRTVRRRAYGFKAGRDAITSRGMSFFLNDLDDMKTYPVYFMGESVNALK